MNTKTSNVIAYLHFWMVLLVVQIHSYSAWDAINGGDKNWNEIIQIFISQGLCRVSVPTLFLISGYLFFKGLDKWNFGVWEKKISSRVRSIVIPYFLWNLIAFVFEFFNESVKNKGICNIIDLWNQLGGIRIFWDSASGWMPIDFPLWFLRNLIIITLLTPVIYYYTKKMGLAGVVLLGVIHLSDVHMPIGLSWGTPFFFSLGCFLQINKIDLLEALSPFRYCSYIISIILMLAITYAWGRYPINGYLHAALMIFGSVAMINIAADIAKGKPLKIAKDYASAAFLIFAAHGIIINYIYLTLNVVIPSNNMEIVQVICFFLRTMLNVGVCLGVYMFMKKYMSHSLKFLIGNR